MAIAATLSPVALALEGDPYAGETPAAARQPHGMVARGEVRHVHPLGCLRRARRNLQRQANRRHRRVDHAPREDPGGRLPGFAKDFNPVKYDPDVWANLAKEAGMRYMVITSKHHDGFALFPSEASDWDIADATPWKKDLIGPLAEAARAEGLKFGLYYSQAQDWTPPRRRQGRLQGRRRLGRRPQGQLRHLHRQDRRAPGPRNPHPLPARRPLVGHAAPDDRGARRKTRRTPQTAPRHHPQQPPRRRLQGRHRNPRAAHPRHRISRPRLGDLHDHERHLGLQELRPQLEIHRDAASATSSISSARAATTCSTSAPPPKAKSQPQSSSGSSRSARG